MKIENKNISEIKEYQNNPRKNDNAVEKVAESIKQFGFKQPLVIDTHGNIIVGHTRYKAAKLLKLKHVPCVIADDLSKEKINAYRIADNKVSEFAEWDMGKLAEELESLSNNEFTGFDTSEIDSILANIEVVENYSVGNSGTGLNHNVSNFAIVQIDKYSFKIEDVGKFSIFEEIRHRENEEKERVNKIILKHLYNAIDEIEDGEPF
jgi:hypothetical protein